MDIKLSNGKEFKNLTMNGDMYVSKKKVEMQDFSGGLNHVEITDGDEVTTIDNAVCDTVLHWPEGYLFNIREMTQGEKLSAMMDDINMALVELAGIVVGGE